MKTILRLLGFMRPFTAWVLLSIFLAAAATASGIGLLGTSAYLIASAALHPSVAVLQVAIVGVRFFGIVRSLLRYLERLTSHSVNFRLLSDIRVAFYQAIEPLPPAVLAGYQGGDLLGRAINDVNTLENFYVRAAAPPVTAGLITLFTGWFVGRYDLQLGLAAALGLILAGLAAPLVVYGLAKRAGGEVITQRTRLQAHLVDDLLGQDELAANNRIPDRLAELKQAGDAYGQKQRRLAAWGGFSSAAALLLTQATVLVVTWLAIPQVQAGELSGIDLAVVILVVLACFEIIQPLGTAAQQMGSSLRAAERLFSLMDLPPEQKSPVQPLEPRVQAEPPSSNACLAVRHLTYRYRADLAPAVDDLTLEIEEGKRIAIVGPSGAGKTTLIHLIFKFLDAPQGTIYLRDAELSSLSADEVRSQIGLIGQSPYIFAGTLRYNLKLARPDASDDDMRSVIAKVGLQDWLERSAGQLDTWLGEGGSAISGGERQRLAAARLLLRAPQIIILDEPAAHLDPLNARRLTDTLLNVFAGGSQIWVTHQLAGLETMDEIIVMDHGRVVQRGRHAELVEQEGLYRRLFHVQSQILFEMGEPREQ